MPSYKGQLSDDDIDSIIAYLKTLSKNYKPETVKQSAAAEPPGESTGGEKAADGGEKAADGGDAADGDADQPSEDRPKQD